MSFGELLTSDERYFAYVATQTADTYLSRGYTSIRDASGNTFSLKKAIDRGIVNGPRIYPSGMMIFQTSGHSDHCFDAHKSKLIGGEDDFSTQFGGTALDDGVPEVLKAVRENLRRGASQIKIAVGGGTSSYADPLSERGFIIGSVWNILLRGTTLPDHPTGPAHRHRQHGHRMLDRLPPSDRA